MSKKSLFINGKENTGNFKPIADKKWYAGIIEDFSEGATDHPEYGKSKWIKLHVKIVTDQLKKKDGDKWIPVKCEATNRKVRTGFLTQNISPKAKLGKALAEIWGLETSEELADDIYADAYDWDINTIMNKKVAIYIVNNEGKDGNVYSNVTKFKPFNAWKAEFVAKAEGYAEDDEDGHEWGVE